jgi:cutinase
MTDGWGRNEHRQSDRRCVSCRLVAEVSARDIAGFLGAAIVTASALLIAPIDTPPASAAPCPDVEVVFARGTGEPPGVGGVGQAFVGALQSQVGSKSVGVYGVNYEASADFADPLAFASTVIDGVRDEMNHVQSMAASCPQTRMVLGGYSQGAAVTGFATADSVPPEVPAGMAPAPMPPEMAKHVAAVALFGKPSAPFLQNYGAPPIVIGHLYAPKTIDLCASGDTICDGTPGGLPTPAHGLYPVNGMVGQAATFAVNHL